jgi:protein O-mannosyl-transferase
MKRSKEQRQYRTGKKNSSQLVRVAYWDKWRYYIALTVILLLSYIAYSSIIKNDFVWDDTKYIVNNEHNKDMSWNGITTIFTDFNSHNYAPITDLINGVQVSISGLSPKAFHSGSLLFHLINIVLVFWFIRILSGNWNLAAVSALLFGIHPVQVESVAWASGGSTLYFTAFFLGSLIAYLYFLETDHKKYLFWSLGFFILSLLSKAMAVMLPVVLMLIDYYKNRKISKKVLLEKIPFFILSLVIGLVSIMLRNQQGVTERFTEFSVAHRFVFACYGFITYLDKLILPLNLSAFYAYPINAENIPVFYYFYVLFFLALVAVIIYSLRFSKKVLFGVGFFAITLFTVSQLFPVGGTIMADRYIYLSSIGIFYLAGEGFILLWSKKLKLVTVILLSTFSIFYSVKTYARCGVWKDEMTLWNDVISQNENVPYAYHNRGRVFVNEKRYHEALKDFNKAIELQPGNANYYYGRGVIFMNENRNAEAVSDFNKAIELQPDYFDAYLNQGVVLINEKRYEEAISNYTRAIALKPDNAKFFYNRGIVFMNEEKNAEALNDFNKAIELQPDYVDAYLNRGIVFKNEKRYEEAISNYTRAIALKPGYAIAYYNRGVAEFSSNNKDAACSDLKQAASLGYQPAADALSRVCQ